MRRLLSPLPMLFAALMMPLALVCAAGALAQNLANGQNQYTLNCSGCHGAVASNKDRIQNGATRNGGAADIYAAMTFISPPMVAQVYPYYIAGNITDTDLIDIADYIDSRLPAQASGSLVMPGNTDFGMVDVNAQGNAAVFTVNRAGTTSVTISGFANSNPAEFVVSANTCVAGNSTYPCTISVVFRPAALGARTGTLTLSSNGTGSPQAIVLTGSGVDEIPAPVPLPPPPPKRETVMVIEYYHQIFDHYFITAIADEITKLDNGTFAGWTRTGKSFKAYFAPGSGTATVCRFFSSSFAPKSSHFYGASAPECTAVKSNLDWKFEGDVLYVTAPAIDGACPTGTSAVYRLYNNGQGAAPNHRYTTDTATRNLMLTKGWAPEGNGALGVTMCAPN